MLDVWISWKDTKDPQACNTNPQVYTMYSRDPERTPFQWDSTTSAGFSTNPNTWLPVSPDYKDVNVASEDVASSASHLEIYKALIKLRQDDTLRYGSFEAAALNQNVLIIVRKLQGAETYLTLLNIWDNTETVDVAKYVTGSLFYEIVSVNSKHRAGDEVTDPTKVVLEGKESFVLRAPINMWDLDYFKYRLHTIAVNLIL